MDTSDGKTRELWGRKFKTVKNGLDEAEVFSFIGGLIDQNNALASKLEHLDSLTKLAERTVIEANKQAQGIKKEAEEKANASAASIIAEAEEKARKEIERIISEGERKAKQSAQEKIAAAEEKAESIKINANDEANKTIAEAKQSAVATEQQAQETLKAAGEKADSIRINANDEANRIIAEAKQNAMATEQQAQEMLKAAGEKADSIRINAERKANKIIAEAKEKAEDLVNARTASAEKEAQSMLEAARAKAEEEAHLIKQKSEQMLKRSRRIAEDEIKEKLKKVYQGLLSSLEEIEETTVIPTEVSKDTEQVKPEPIVHLKAERKTKESQKQPPLPEEKEVKGSPDIYEGIVELVMPPPVSLDLMLQLHKHLRNMPNIEVSSLGVSADKSIAIRVSLENPTPLRKMLEDLPEVEATAEAPRDAEVLPSTKKTGETALVRRIIVTTRKQTN
jgi:vacuolar-type H+-ATPase subunit H